MNNADREILQIVTDLKRERDEARAEVERLRSREAALVEIAEAVVEYATLKRYMDSCEWCGQIGQSVDHHAADCPVTKARALLAPGAVEGEAK